MVKPRWSAWLLAGYIGPRCDVRGGASAVTSDWPSASARHGMQVNQRGRWYLEAVPVAALSRCSAIRYSLLPRESVCVYHVCSHSSALSLTTVRRSCSQMCGWVGWEGCVCLQQTPSNLLVLRPLKPFSCSGVIQTKATSEVAFSP
mgnify:CR=1 FL=1